MRKHIHTIALLCLVIGNFCLCTTNGSYRSRASIEKALYEIEMVQLPYIEQLFIACAENNIPTDYEQVDYTVVKDFIAYVRDDMAHNNRARAAYALRYLEEACEDMAHSLRAYLSGEKKPRELTRYVTGPITIHGSSMTGKAVNGITGEETTRPLFFTGYGHFDHIIRDMPKMTGYGVNILQTEIGPWDTVIAGTNNAYAVNTAGIARLENILREAEKYNIKVDVLLSPHYFPEWVFQKYPYLRENTGGFLTYNVYEQEAKKVIETHITGVMEQIQHFTSLNSVCLSNEPTFSTARNFKISNNNAAVNIMWRQYLSDTHGSIEALNAIYKTSYSGFDTVPMPRGIAATPQFYDWMVFNDTVFAGWHQWMAEIVHTTAPHIPVHVKLMDATLSPSGWKPSLEWGTDAERFAEFTQLNGNDANNFLFHPDGNIIAKMKWYDLLTSLQKRPIYNSEDHIIADRARNYIPQQVLHVRSDLWQGAVHGRAATTIWVWERTHAANSDFAGSILHRPDVVAAVGKTNLDLNRLAHEITALQNEPVYTAILYSNPARVYDETYVPTLSRVYEDLLYNGVKPAFITEKQLANGELNNYRVIIIPATVHVSPGTINAIAAFMRAGGAVIITGEESLSRDYYDRSIIHPDRSFIMENSIMVTSAEAGIAAKREAGLPRVTLRDHHTGVPVYGVEWLTTEYNGKLLINMCNYEWDNKSIGIFINDQPLGNVMDLISGQNINAAYMELPPYTPVLLSVDIHPSTLFL